MDGLPELLAYVAGDAIVSLCQLWLAFVVFLRVTRLLRK